jgi:hypothetical protein
MVQQGTRYLQPVFPPLPLSANQPAQLQHIRMILEPGPNPGQLRLRFAHIPEAQPSRRSGQVMRFRRFKLFHV